MRRSPSGSAGRTVELGEGARGECVLLSSRLSAAELTSSQLPSHRSFPFAPYILPFLSLSVPSARMKMTQIRR